jgi:hypothetical protein
MRTEPTEDAAQLTERLKTLRVLHQLLMVVAEAILAFALRADHSKEYRAALEQLTALKETRLDTWATFVHEHYEHHKDQNDRFAREIVGKAGLPIQGKPKVNEPVFADMPPFADR